MYLKARYLFTLSNNSNQKLNCVIPLLIYSGTSGIWMIISRKYDDSYILDHHVPIPYHDYYYHPVAFHKDFIRILPDISVLISTIRDVRFELKNRNLSSDRCHNSRISLMRRHSHQNRSN
jgi:hypothetical protein